MIGALILAGGKNRRMGGFPKALLPLGEGTYLSHLERELAGFPEKLVSVNDPFLAERSQFRPVTDVFPDAGPLSGIYSALLSCKSSALLVVPCDLPFFCGDFARFLASSWDHSADALLPRAHDGNLQPLCGIYSKTCLSALHSALTNRQYKVLDFVKQLRYREIPLSGTSFSDAIFENVNTPDHAEALTRLPGDQSPI